jgi:hypothetical protein
MKNIEKRSSQLLVAAKTTYRLSIASVTAIILIILLPGKTFAQGYVEGVNISYEHMPMKVETPTGDQKFTGNNLKISTSVPVFLTHGKSKYLIVGGNLEAFNFSGTHPAFDVKRVYSISPTLGYSTMVSPTFNLTALLVPTMNSDYKDVKSSDIKFAGILRGSWKANENLTWKAVLGYRRQFYGPQYIVTVGMDWKASEKIRIFGDVPKDLTINYALSQKTNAGFNLAVQNSTYRLNSQDRYFEYNTVNPGLFVERYISSNWAIRATAAYTLIRNMEIYNKTDKAKAFIDFAELGSRADPINLEVSPGLAFKVGLSYRIVPGKNN